MEDFVRSYESEKKFMKYQKMLGVLVAKMIAEGDDEIEEIAIINDALGSVFLKSLFCLIAIEEMSPDESMDLLNSHVKAMKDNFYQEMAYAKTVKNKCEERGL